MAAKIHQYKTSERWWFFCPGCKYEHPVDKRWQWNGSVERPTFTPSLLVTTTPEKRCHSFVTDGQIRFLDDCFHELKGQTVEIPDYHE